jgi:serine/threonine-protein kinase
MGIVYAAHHELLGQRVALKLMRREVAENAEAVGRFLNEARAAARIRSEHVARVLDVGTLEGGTAYMVLEYLDGADLSQVLELRGELPVTDAVDYLLQAVEGVAHAHALGIVHRDLKPPNLFLARRQDGENQIKVLDFGISKVTGGVLGATSSGNLTATNAVLGSPFYMSPEQLLASKDLDARSDVWALGVIAYELLTRALPFDGENVVALFAAIQTSEPRPLRALRPDVPAALDAAIMKCLRRKREERFSSVSELARAMMPYGTRVSELAFERIHSVLPAASLAMASPLRLEDPAQPGHIPSATMLAQPRQRPSTGRVARTGPDGVSPAAITTSPWASAPTAGATERGRRGKRMGMAIGALVVLAGAGALIATRMVGASGNGGVAPSAAAGTATPATGIPTPSATVPAGADLVAAVPAPLSATPPPPSAPPARLQSAAPPRPWTSPTRPAASAAAQPKPPGLDLYKP